MEQEPKGTDLHYGGDASLCQGIKERVFDHLWLLPASAACPWRFLLVAEPNMQHCLLPALLYVNPHARLAANPSPVLVI